MCRNTLPRFKNFRRVKSEEPILHIQVLIRTLCAVILDKWKTTSSQNVIVSVINNPVEM